MDAISKQPIFKELISKELISKDLISQPKFSKQQIPSKRFQSGLNLKAATFKSKRNPNIKGSPAGLVVGGEAV